MTNKNGAIEQFKKETIDNIMQKLTEMQNNGELILPRNYHAGNALKVAWLHLQTLQTKDKTDLLINRCTKASICNTLLDMVLKGESIGKKQCYFVAYGNELTLVEDYRGQYMRTLRDTEIKKINPNVIYEKDKFIYRVDEFGEYQLVQHVTALQNIDINKIIGAYAVVINKDGSTHLEVMTKAQIEAAWNQGHSFATGRSKAHNNFTDQMCKKTILNRACKIALGSSPDEIINIEDNNDAAPDAAQDIREKAQNIIIEEPKMTDPIQVTSAEEGKDDDQDQKDEMTYETFGEINVNKEEEENVNAQIISNFEKEGKQMAAAKKTKKCPI